MSTKPLVEIHDWFLFSRFSNITDRFPSPLRRGICLRGTVCNHPRLGYAELILTSPIVRFNYEERTAETESGTHYKLCYVDPVFDKWTHRAGIELSDYNTNGDNYQKGDPYE